MPKTVKPKTDKDIALNVELGCKLFVQIEGVKERLSSFLIGMMPKSYLIVHTPVMTGIEYILSEGREVVLRYVYLGEVYGFHSTVLRSITTPSKITFLSYPQQIEKINLRKKPRIRCFIPASLHHEQDELKGVIKNLSIEGIKFTTKAVEDSQIRQIPVGKDITICFPLLGIEGVQVLNGKIRNKSGEQDEMDFGIEFNKRDAKIIGMIDAYIKQVRDYVED